MLCRAQLQEHYEFADFAAKAALAVLLKHLPLSLPELWLFCHSPTDPQEPHMVSALLTFVTAFCYRCGKPAWPWCETITWKLLINPLGAQDGVRSAHLCHSLLLQGGKRWLSMVWVEID